MNAVGGCENATHISVLSLSLSIFPFKRLTYVNKLAVLMLYPFICLTISQVGLIKPFKHLIKAFYLIGLIVGSFIRR